MQKLTPYCLYKYFVLAFFSLFLLGLGQPLQAQYKKKTEEEKKNTSPEETKPQPSRLNQDPEPSSWRDRIVLGGNVGLQFGSQTMIHLAPSVGYRVMDKLILGVGATYSYYRFRYSIGGLDVEEQFNLYGGRAYQQYFISEQIFLYAEQEVLNAVFYDPVFNKTTNQTLFSPFVGGGVAQPLGNRGFVMLMGLYNLNYDPATSIYASPIVVRVGFGF
ncbi:hypothetical protein [Eisenibacter elegans]|uniref:hypothetical protein n=1 Tax=Eisenibacter elegans TaxID=997 RepID=UPI00040E6770|nr:hypothetical protein [Eisenibacter elegans]